jgi:hypothetical protein
MKPLSAAQLRRYRERTFRYKPTRRVRTVADAVRFVNERGFVYFWPITGVTLPSLWAAVAGNRPVSDQHDDPGHITWGWKDSLLGERKWYYAKLLRGKATLVSLATLPYFYALSENYGDYQHDYLALYDEGRLTADARAVFEALLEKGPLHTIALRKEARLSANTRFEKALVELQTGLKILPVGVAQAGAWRYSHIYDIVDRFFPELPAQAGALTRAQARAHLARLFLDSVGAATAKDVQRLFRWPAEEVKRSCAQMLESGAALAIASVAGESGEWLASPALLNVA